MVITKRYKRTRTIELCTRSFRRSEAYIPGDLIIVTYLIYTVFVFVCLYVCFSFLILLIYFFIYSVFMPTLCCQWLEYHDCGRDWKVFGYS